ncbi:MAG: HAD hydrolase family protein [Burkholderiales bacterium]|jgi:3-deoxy-D-manno-octulosonate 8-phosphate phosphatase (KDO 8-P phosphatase)|nr:HAD hydrolase family protein [Burkholderiales bacterium]
MTDSTLSFSFDAALLARAKKIKLLTCDVDGVLTDGRIYFNDDGIESRAFCAADGLGLKLLIAAGIEVAWITGSRAKAILHRANVLGVKRVIRNVMDKKTPWEQLVEDLGLPFEACAHIGDDAPDLPLITGSGLGVTVPNAPPSLRDAAHFVTRAQGGMGAVREVCDLILSAQNIRFDATMQRSA